MRDRDAIDDELRLVTELRRSARVNGPTPADAPLNELLDELLDERHQRNTHPETDDDSAAGGPFCW